MRLTQLRSGFVRSGSIALLVCSMGAVGRAQDDKAAKDTFFENLLLDPEGHICYTESLDGTTMNRLEYRDEGHIVMNLFDTEGSLAKEVESTDFDRDGTPDLLMFTWTTDGTSVNRKVFYRGDGYEKHLRMHLMHALRTSQHALIKDHPEEKERAKEIMEHLAELDAHTIAPEETGVYSSHHFFEQSSHKDILHAFAAADNLHRELRSVVSGDYRVLSQKSDIVKTYKLDIGILLDIDPTSAFTKR